MADYLVTDTELTSVADAIRTKGGTSASLSFPTEFVSAINAIPTGGGKPAQINFIDYDGTIVKSYTASEWANVSALPSNPSHDGLTAQGWNWTKAQIDAQLSAMPTGNIWVGQMYITESGDTEIDVIFADSARLSPIMTIAVNGTVTVNWGDNTTPDTVTGSSLTSTVDIPHTYASAGSYTIKIHVVSGSFAFSGASSYLLLRKSTSVGESRIYANTIRAIRLGNGVTNLKDYAFFCFASLESITIPSGVTGSIGGYTFNGCNSLKSVTIPSGVTSIGTYAFYNCNSLTFVAIPSGTTSIGTYAFYTCYSLESITIPSGVTGSIGSYAFGDCRSLKSIILPSGVTSIGTYAFYDCYSLTSINIPSGVTSIGTYAFYTCFCLASITIPSGVTSIGNSAFYNSSGMAEYHIKPTTPPTIGSSTFSSIASDCKIYVPSASLATYKSATRWSSYASQIYGE